jgi:TPR repeat protein
MHWLGRIYGGQEEYPPDHSEAFHWLSLAAGAGDADSQCSLGVCYINGQGTGTNEALGAAWYRQAASNGCDWACYLLGLCYRDGTGVRRNVRLARYWFEKAASLGVKEAETALRKLNQAGTKKLTQ